MKSKSFILPFLLAAFLLAASQVSAQKSYAVGISGGATIPTGKFNDTYSTGYAITAFIALGVPDLPIGVRFDGIYNQFSGRTVASVVNPDLRLLGILGNLLYTFPSTTAKPYLLAGGGFYNSKVDSPDAKSRNDFGFSAGLGATFGLGPIAAVIEAQYHGVSRDTNAGGTIHFVPITIGIMF